MSVPKFRIRVPASWFQFDAWRATRTADLARIVDAKVEQRRQLRPYRGALLRMLRDVAEDAQRRGALLCAVTADPIAQAGNLLATLMVFHTPGSPDADENTVDGIAAGVTAHEGGEGSASWRRVAIVELPAGRAVRVTGVDVVGEGDHALDIVTMHTLWPAPEGGVVDVVLTSPQTQLADALLDLFDAVSGTFAWAEADHDADAEADNDNDADADPAAPTTP